MKNKRCSKCRRVLSILYFVKRSNSKDGFDYWCKKCRSISKKKWCNKNRKYLNNYNKIWWKDTFAIKPWYRTYKRITTRCCSHPFYKKMRVKNFLTPKDLEYLWFRDKAYLMKNPTIDRIKSKENYTVKNSRFLELSDNLKHRHRRL